MTVDLTCQACDASFDVELSDLVDEPAVQCPSCEARAPRAALEGMTSALDDLFTQLALLKRKFSVQFEVDSGDLPPAYDREPPRSAAPEEEAGEDEHEDEPDEGWDEEEARAEEDEER
jgi:hypothetical protein